MASLHPDELREITTSFLRRVIIHENSIQVLVSRSEMRQALQKGSTFISTNSGPRKRLDANDRICLTIEAKLKRCGGEVHLIVPPYNATTVLPGEAKPSLIKAIARAHGWYEKVLDGKAFDQRSLAQQARLTERYVGKVFAFAFLAPDIVEAILDGRQPHDLNFGNLCKYIPLTWAEQRRQFGFPPL